MTDQNTQSKVQSEKVKNRPRLQPDNIARLVKENPIYKAVKKPLDDKEKDHISNVNAQQQIMRHRAEKNQVMI